MSTNSTREQLNPLSYYAQTLYKELPREIFKPNAWRLVGILFCFVLIGTCGTLMASSSTEVWQKLLLGIFLGISYGTLAFFSHELLHGSIVKNRRIQDFLAFFTFMPFLVSPTFWRYWHNNLHHGNTQAIITDPDAFPTLKIYKFSKFMQNMFAFTPGSGHKRSYLYFCFWFSFHVFAAQTYLRFRNNTFSSLDHRRVNFEFGAQILIVLAGLYFMGPQNLLWTLAIPLLVQNYVIMSYVATNHNLNPLTKVNDPLANSLTVTNNPVLEYLHLNFGYHVEHHIFPTVNAVHAKTIHELLKKKYPDRFHVMPKTQAIKMLYQTSRIYKNSTTLIHPITMEIYETLKHTSSSDVSKEVQLSETSSAQVEAQLPT